MKNKIFDDTEKKITDILNQREEEIKVRTQNVEDAKADVAKAEKALEEATQANNLDAYYNAKQAIYMANTLIEMSVKRLDELKNQPLVSEDEYKAMIDKVYGEIEKNNQKNVAEVVKLIDKILSINEEDGEFIQRGNDILKSLQIDIHQEKDYYKKHVYERTQYKNTFIPYLAQEVNIKSYREEKEKIGA